MATPFPLKPLKVSPDTGPVGTPFTITSEGVLPGKEVGFFWGTVEGSYVTELVNNKVVFRQRKFTPTRLSLGTAIADAQGRVTATSTAPEDYGEIHDIYAAVDGVDVGKGGFFVTRSFSLNPKSGSIGTPITLTVRGLGPGPLNSTLALRYDNKYTGWASATTTRGTAKAQFRAAGPVGKRLVEAIPASHLTPYINVQQSSVGYLVTFRELFTVTEDKGAPSPGLAWPDPDRVNPDASAPRTILGQVSLTAPGARGTLAPGRGPVGTRINMEVTGLPGGAEVELTWVTVTDNDLFGWNPFQEPMSLATVAADGTLKTTAQVPNTLGGWHAIWITQGDKVLTEAAFLVERSLYEVTPVRVKAGELFKVELKGLGWNEMDNGVAVTYDNAYVGYACGFSSQGNVTLYLVATGESGTHLIDLYPMIYESGQGGEQAWPWQYNLPQLTALEDHPGLGLGYRLPIVRLAVEIVP